MAVFAPASASNSNDNNFLIKGAVNTTLTLTNADTEYSFVIPAGTKAVMFKARQFTVMLYAFDAGDIALGNYVTMKSGTANWLPSTKIATGGLTVYISSKLDNTIVEIVYYN